MWPHAKKSKGVRSGERSARNRGEACKIQRPGNVSLKELRTMCEKCGRVPSCWNTTKSIILSATIGAAGIAQACPGTMLTWLLLQQKIMDRKCAVGWDPSKHSPLYCYIPIPWRCVIVHQPPYSAAVAIDEATGMKGSLITEQDVCQQMFIVKLPQVSRGTWPCMPHSPQVQDDGAPGCDKLFSSVRSGKFATQWSLGSRIPD